jgi:excisionase family DNA binding protein
MLSQQFLSVKDIADLLKVGEAAVRSWIKLGDLRAVDVGREWRIAPRDLESFLQRHANRPPDNLDRREGALDGGGTSFRSPTETSPKLEE